MSIRFFAYTMLLTDNIDKFGELDFTPFFGWSFASFASMPTIISCFLLMKIVINSAKSLIIRSRLLVSSRFCSSRRCYCCRMLVEGPACLIDF